MLTLSEKDLKDLDTFIQDLPLKHGLPLLNFLNSKIKEAQEKQTLSMQETLVETVEG